MSKELDDMTRDELIARVKKLENATFNRLAKKVQSKSGLSPIEQALSHALTDFRYEHDTHMDGIYAPPEIRMVRGKSVRLEMTFLFQDQTLASHVIESLRREASHLR